MYSYFCLHVQPLLKVFLGVRDPRSKQMCDELSCKHLFVEFLYNVSRLYRNWKSNPGNPSYCTEWATATLMASLERTLAVILLIVLHTSCLLILVGRYYSSQIFSSLPNLGPKIHGNFGILKPKSTREIRKKILPTDLTRWIWAQACRFRDLATPNEGGEKSWWFFLGLRNIPFYWGKYPSSFVEICWVYPRWLGREKKMEFTICDGSLSKKITGWIQWLAQIEWWQSPL